MKPTPSKTWLQRLKEESWEAELLVSAIAIFGIFQCFTLIDSLCNFFIDYLDESQFIFGYFIIISAELAISSLACIFITHFILRSYWIGLLGLNSVFPDYSLEDTAYSKYYTDRMINYLPKLSTTIEGLEELCSVLFSIGFLLLGIYSYIAFTNTIYLLLYTKLKDLVPETLLLLPIFIFGVLLLIQMLLSIFANIKSFQSAEFLQKSYFISTKYTNLLVFGPTAKYFLQISMIFGSNFKKKKGIVIFILFIFQLGAITIVFRSESTNMSYLFKKELLDDTTQANPQYYQPNNQRVTFLLVPEISSDIIKEKATRLFVPIFKSEKRSISKNCILLNNDDLKDSDITQAKLTCYSKNHIVSIDDITLQPQFSTLYHPITGQFGIATIIDLSKYQGGEHQLTITKHWAKEETRTWNISFFITED